MPRTNEGRSAGRPGAAWPSIDGQPLKTLPPTKESGTVWIGPEKAMAERISALEAERDALREALETALPWIGVSEGRRGNWCPPEVKEAARSALERRP